MSPRTYQLGQRQINAEQNRARVLEAARELLLSSQDFTGFSLEAVARQAKVTRVTVYHQFGSKSGLLEAMCDAGASLGGMQNLPKAFQNPNPEEALKYFLVVFGQFWQSDRPVTRKLRALAALDTDFKTVIKARDERRRTGLGVLVQRFKSMTQPASNANTAEIVNVLCTLSSFETFDTLAGPTRTIEEVTPTVQQLCLNYLKANL